MSDFKGRRLHCRILLDRRPPTADRRPPTADRRPPTARHSFGTLIPRGRTKMFVSLFQIRRQHTFDPFHECADSARQIAPMCYDEGHGERPATKIGYDLHKRSTL